MEDEVDISSSDGEDLVYTVHRGDTLESIAQRQGVPFPWLIQLNELTSYVVKPGDVLRVFGPPPQLSAPRPIEALLFQSPGGADAPGTLSLQCFCLRFEPASPSSAPRISINLLGHLENATMPHPHTADVTDARGMYILVVSYLKDPYDQDSMETISFAGKNSDLVIYKFHIDRAAELAQRNSHYIAPKPNEIAARQPQSTPTSLSLRLGARPQQPIIMTGKSEIFEEGHVTAIRSVLPIRFRTAPWKLLYQLSADGCSYQTLYQRTGQLTPLVLVMETDAHEKFGVYLPSGLRNSKDYYGTGETLLFRLSPAFQAFAWNRSTSNQLFTLSTLDELVVGGGSPAIWLGPGLLEGYSEPCAIFASPRLTRHRHFRVMNAEVWRIGEESGRRYKLPIT
jgi:LysM repeat protein